MNKWTRLNSRSLALLLFLLVVNTAVKKTNAENANQPHHPSGPLKEHSFGGIQAITSLLGLSQAKTTEVDRQDIKVIGAGVGRTGTASFVVALARLGLRGYQMSSGVWHTPGHMDLWYEHQALVRAGNSAGIASDILDSMALHGINGTTSMPACFLYQEMMDRYPKAKVVLTVRGDGNGQAWARSVQSSIAKFAPVLNRVPLRFVPRLSKFRAIMDWIFAEVGAQLVNDVFDEDELAKAYEYWVDHVKATVPPERLLVFAAQDGWEPLCEFVSPLDVEMKRHCDDILASGEPYPRANDAASVRRKIFFMHTVCNVFQGSVLAFVLYRMYLVLKQSKKAKKKKD